MRFTETLPFGIATIKSKTNKLANKKQSTFALASLSLKTIICVQCFLCGFTNMCITYRPKVSVWIPVSRSIYWQCVCNTAEGLLTSYMWSMWVHNYDSIELGKPLGNFCILTASISNSLISIIASLALDWGSGTKFKELCSYKCFFSAFQIIVLSFVLAYQCLGTGFLAGG